MAIIYNAQDWWDTVDRQRDNLLEIIAHHIDLDSPANEIPGDATSPMTGRTVLQEIHLLIQNRDPLLARYLNGTWCMASDSYAWSVPGWGDFCDLCSEEWALYEKEAIQ